MGNPLKVFMITIIVTPHLKQEYLILSTIK